MIGLNLGPYRVEGARLRRDGHHLPGQKSSATRVSPPATARRMRVIHPQLLATPGFFKRFLREAESSTAGCAGNVVRTIGVDATIADGRGQLHGARVRGGEEPARASHRPRRGPGRSSADRSADDGRIARSTNEIVHRDLKRERHPLRRPARADHGPRGHEAPGGLTVVLTREAQFARSSSGTRAVRRRRDDPGGRPLLPRSDPPRARDRQTPLRNRQSGHGDPANSPCVAAARQ